MTFRVEQRQSVESESLEHVSPKLGSVVLNQYFKLIKSSDSRSNVTLNWLDMEFKVNYWDRLGQTWIENRNSDEVKKRFKSQKNNCQ